jgi:hypothetical protein
MADTAYMEPTGASVRWMDKKHQELVQECTDRRILHANLSKAPKKHTLAAMLTCFEAGMYSDEGGKILHIDQGVIKYTESLWVGKVDAIKARAEREGLDTSGNAADIITRLAQSWYTQQTGVDMQPIPSVQSGTSPSGIHIPI